MRRQVESMLSKHGVREVLETWPHDLERSDEPPSQLREVLQVLDDQSPDLDEILLQLRDAWRLELDVDPDANVDDTGRKLGLVLWHAIVLATRHDRPNKGAYVTIWATAGSLSQMERLVNEHFDQHLPSWRCDGFYSVDRVAFDDRPEDLVDLPPRRSAAEVHQSGIEEW
jgi:hypothetical protein